MPIEPVPFVHYTVDFSFKEIATAKDGNVTICKITSNSPLDTEYVYASDGIYGWVRGIKVGKPFGFDTGCFSFILVRNCCGDLGVFTVAHVVPDDPTFHCLIFEGDELVALKCSDVNVGYKASYEFAWCSVGQRLRIETIPDFRTFDRLRDALYGKRQSKEKPQEDEEDTQE